MFVLACAWERMSSAKISGSNRASVAFVVLVDGRAATTFRAQV